MAVIPANLISKYTVTYTLRSAKNGSDTKMGESYKLQRDRGSTEAIWGRKHK